MTSNRCGTTNERQCITQSSGNVFVDLGFDAAEAEDLWLRATLMIRISRFIERENLTRAAAASLLSISRSCLSDLLRGKIGLFTTSTLIRMLAAAKIERSAGDSGQDDVACGKNLP